MTPTIYDTTHFMVRELNRIFEKLILPCNLGENLGEKKLGKVPYIPPVALMRVGKIIH